MQFVSTPDAGVPSAGVTNVGLVRVALVALTTEPEPVTVVGAYIKQRQFPAPSETNKPQSPATVVMFAAPGRIRLVALWVNVSAPAKRTNFQIPAETVPRPVMVVVPVMRT